MIWKRWTKEYLPQGNTTPKWFKNDQRQLQTGDLVWLVDDGIKRSQYKMARILTIYPGADGVIRSAEVKTKDGVFKRPSVRLAPMF